MSRFVKSRRIDLFVSLFIFIGLAISGYVLLKGAEIASNTNNLLTEDIPNFERVKELETLLLEEERLLYEYYATEDESYVHFDLASVRNKVPDALSHLNRKFPDKNELADLTKHINFIRSVGDEFIDNIALETTDWTQARNQLANISKARRESKAILNILVSINESDVERVEGSILDSLFEVKLFVILYGLFSIFVTITVGQVVKAYLSSLSKSQRLSLFPKRNPNPVISLSSSGTPIYSNPACHKLLEANGLASNNIEALLPPDFESCKERTLKGEQYCQVEYVALGINIHCQIHWLSDQEEWDLHLRDITAQKQAQEKLAYQAFHNADTRLPNKHALMKHASDMLSEKASFVLSTMEIREYRTMLSVFGAEAAFFLVQEVAEALEEWCTNKSEIPFTLFQIAESQFAMIAQNALSENQVVALADSISKSVSVSAFSSEHHVKLNFGVSFFPDHATDVSELFRNAVTALDKSVRQGESEVVVFNPQIRERIEYEQTMLHDMRRTLEQGAFLLNFQPQLNLHNNKIVGVEVLLRWRNNDNWISPGEFIPLAESSGLIINIGAWVLKEACIYAKKLIDMEFSDLVVAVNISPRQFASKDFYDSVVFALERSGLPAKNLELEITEGVLIIDENAAISSISDLKKLGVKLSIDDFGTGYSSLSYLSKFNIDKLKIDQSFIRNMLEEKRNEAIVKTIIELGKNLDLVLIAEGVETIEHLDRLKVLECDEIQGYYFSRPLTFEDLKQFIIEKS